MGSKMKSRDNFKQKDEKGVKIYIYMIILSLVLLGGSLVVIFTFQNRTEKQLIEEINEYHLFSAKSYLVIRQEVNNFLSAYVHSYNDISYQHRQTPLVQNSYVDEIGIRDDLNGLLFKTNQRFHRLQILKDRYGEDQFIFLMERLAESVIILNSKFESIVKRDIDTDEAEKLLNSIAVTAHQLEKLHESIYSEESSLLTKTKSKHLLFRVFVLIVGVIFNIFIISILVIRINKIIIERRNAVSAFRENAKALKSAMRIAKLGAWEWNILTDETVLSDEYCEIFQLEKDKSYGTEDYLKLLHSDDREEQLSIIEQSIKDKKGLSSHYRIVLDNNEIKHIHSDWEVYTDSENNAVKMAGTVQDITERVKSELVLREAKDKLEERVKERTLELEKSNKALAENEERFSKIFQEGPLGMAIIDDKYKLARTNKIFRNMLGYNEKELIGMTFVDITHEKDKRKDTDGIKDLYKGKIPVYQTEKRYMKKNGDILWANLTASAIFSEDKKFLYAVSMIEDIGDRKIADQKIKKSLREKEVLLKEIHHRVKNNLQMISSLLNLQANSIKDKKIIKNLMDMRSRVLSMSLIHENIYQSEDLSEVDINNYVTMLTENLIQTYSEEGKSVKIKNKVGKITLDIDRAIPLGLIITELVTNAMQHAFTKKKGGIINISMSEINNTLEMIVSDNGDGLAEGTGINEKGNLGFMLVKTLSEQLDADLDVKVGNGTKYTMSFTK